MYKLFGIASALCLASSFAMAWTKPDQVKFSLTPNPAFLACLSGSTVAPHASVTVMRGSLNDTGTITVSGLKPNLNFDVFTVQRSSLDENGAPVKNFKGFGLAWYQSDLHSDESGNAKVVIKTILLDQIFGFDADPDPESTADSNAPVPTVLKPTHTFHLGFWFNNPEDARPCGFDVSKPTPFNGEHNGGPLAAISPAFGPAAGGGVGPEGPLCTIPEGCFP